VIENNHQRRDPAQALDPHDVLAGGLYRHAAIESDRSVSWKCLVRHSSPLSDIRTTATTVWTAMSVTGRKQTLAADGRCQWGDGPQPIGRTDADRPFSRATRGPSGHSSSRVARTEVERGSQRSEVSLCISRRGF
jgi:hypothetical protein